MEGKPTGITYSRQMMPPQTGRPMQPARPVGASPTPETATAPATKTMGATTPYWSPARAWLVAALVACALTPSIFGLATYLFIGPFLAPTILALILILVKARPWTYVTSLVLGVIFPMLVVVIISGGEFNPLDRSGYIATITNLAAIPVITVAGIVGFRTSRPTPAPLRRGMRAGVSVFSTLVAAILVGSFVTSYAANHHALAGSTGGGYDVIPEATTSVVMENFAFTPREVTVPLNKYTEVVIENRDTEGHTFTYKNAGVQYNHELLGGQTVKVLVLFATAGSYQYWCIPHSNGEGDTNADSMTGEIVVA